MNATENLPKDNHSEFKKPKDLLGGFVIGFLCFLFADLIIPKTFRSDLEHDLFLVATIGLTYTPLTALWFPRLGQGGPKNILRRLLIGLLVGCVYTALACASPNFTIVFLVGPSFLAVILLNMLLRDSGIGPIKLASIARDSMNGLIAGLLFGGSYALLINLIFLIMHITRFRHLEDQSAKYYQIIAIGGPIALGISSCLFFHLLRKAFDASQQQSKPSALRVTTQLCLVIASIVIASDKTFFYRYVIPLALWASHPF
jgi:hypothetical protein